MVEEHAHLAVTQSGARAPVHAADEDALAVDYGALVVEFHDAVGICHQTRCRIQPLGGVPVGVEHVDGVANLLVPLGVVAVQHQSDADAALRRFVQRGDERVVPEAPVPVEVEVLHRELDGGLGRANHCDNAIDAVIGAGHQLGVERPLVSRSSSRAAVVHRLVQGPVEGRRVLRAVRLDVEVVGVLVPSHSRKY